MLRKNNFHRRIEATHFIDIFIEMGVDEGLRKQHARFRSTHVLIRLLIECFRGRRYVIGAHASSCLLGFWRDFSGCFIETFGLLFN